MKNALSMHRLTWEEYAGTLAHWRMAFPKVAVLEPRGMSGQNMPVYLLKITDPTVKNTNKQVLLVTTQQIGPESTGTTRAMALSERYLSDDPLAVEMRKKQIVLVMPCVNCEVRHPLDGKPETTMQEVLTQHLTPSKP
jgi:hypothetical protein